MKTQIKPLIIAALVVGNLLAWDSVVHAQNINNTSPPAKRAAPNLEQIAGQLNLTDDQKPKFKAITDNMRQKLRDVRQDTSLSTEDRRSKIQSIQHEGIDKLKAILTPEQFDKYQVLVSPNHRPWVRTPSAPKSEAVAQVARERNATNDSAAVKVVTEPSLNGSQAKKPAINQSDNDLP